jgi:hypothetical protein
MPLSTTAAVEALGLRKPTIIRNFESIFHLQFNLQNPVTVFFTARANSPFDKPAIEVCFTGPFLLKSETTKAQDTSVGMDSNHSRITSEMAIPIKGKSFVPD